MKSATKALKKKFHKTLAKSAQRRANKLIVQAVVYGGPGLRRLAAIEADKAHYHRTLSIG